MKTRRLFAVLCGTLMLGCLGSFAVGCDLLDAVNGSENNGSQQQQQQQETYYTVTVDTYDSAQGSITLSPASADGKYLKDSVVTVTVAATENYTVKSFTVDGAAQQLTEDGTYALTVTKDVTVAATFEQKSVTPQETYYTVSLVFDNAQGTASLSPAATNGKYAEGAVVTVAAHGQGEYLLDKIEVGKTELQPVEGVYSFTVTSNVTVNVTFKKADPVPAELPDEYYGTFYRATGSEIITIGEEGFFVDETECDITLVGTVYHTTWNNGDYIVTINRGSFSYGVLRLTYTADEGMTEINFYEADLENDIVESARGTWVDSMHSVTLVIGAKSLTWNEVEMQLVIIGTDSYGNADLYFLKDGNLLNLYIQSGQFHCYVGDTPDSQYNFVKQTTPVTPDEPEGPVSIPEDLQGHYSYQHFIQGPPDISLKYEIDIYEMNIDFKMNGAMTQITEYTYSESALEEMPGVTFTVGEDSYTVFGVPDYPDYGPYYQISFSYSGHTYSKDLTRSELPDEPMKPDEPTDPTDPDDPDEPDEPVSIPELFQGTFTGKTDVEQVEYTIVVDENSVTVNDTPATDISVSDGNNMQNLNFTVGSDKFVLSYTITTGGYDIDINNSSDYGSMTKQAQEALIPEIFQGTFTGTTLGNSVEYTIVIDENSVTVNGTPATDISVSDGSNMLNLNFTVGGDKFTLQYTISSQGYDIDINNSSDYGSMTKQAQ